MNGKFWWKTSNHELILRLLPYCGLRNNGTIFTLKVSVFFQIVLEQKRQNVVKRFESSDKCHLSTFLTTSIHIETNKQHTKKVEMNIWSHITLNFHVVQAKTLVSQNYDIFRLLLLLWYVSRKRHFFFVFERGHIHCVRHCNISCYFIFIFLRERMLFSPFFTKF